MTTRATLAENAADVLRDAIYTGYYISGERLVELTLADELHVSQNTVREALRILERDGLVERLPRRGAYVRAYSAAAVLELYTLWDVLAGLALGWALDALGRAERRAFAAALIECDRCAQTADYAGSDAALWGFHRGLARAAKREQTAALLDIVLNQVRLAENLRQARAPRPPSGYCERAQGYLALAGAVERGEAEAALRILHERIAAERDSLLPLLDN